MVSRRQTIVALGAGAVAPLTSFAQQPPGKLYRIGFMGAGSPSNMESRVEGLRTGLRDFGYVEGKNLVIEFRWAEGKSDRFPDMAADLVRVNVDLIVTHATPGTMAAKQVTTTIPIVIAAIGDPVGGGVVTSLTHQGGNVTGGSFFSEELSAKRIELLKEMIPRVKQVAALLTPNEHRSIELLIQTMASTSTSLKVEVPQFTVREPAELEGAFAAMAKKRVGAVVIPEIVLLNVHAKPIADLALKHRLPAAGNKEFAEAGGLIGYGVSIPEMFRRAAYFIDKIFKGMKAGDLPIERAAKFETVINLKTAKALGIKIPQSILLQATKVIE